MQTNRQPLKSWTEIMRERRNLLAEIQAITWPVRPIKLRQEQNGDLVRI